MGVVTCALHEASPLSACILYRVFCFFFLMINFLLWVFCSSHPVVSTVSGHEMRISGLYELRYPISQHPTKEECSQFETNAY
ncbi:hypothetical protein F4813DRAFT_126803 [Daldinia decipiens]|uniref:uncharacterized protein n=1 Tax=Daldinia decipiens TaxID=326647 RepID=UPI0020C23837|nr:uncharacterized protein F4813DRAFT_126803 [Daldinia decipiens]KAI1656496.1 hypothetical protein F4813DRAFT_126803 [Daldinia decipiens]